MDNQKSENQKQANSNIGSNPQISPSSSVSPVEPTVVPLAVPPSPPTPISTVVIPSQSEKLPAWFYFLFTVVAVLFFFITFLLVKTLIEKQKQSDRQNIATGITPGVKPSNIPLVSPSVIPTPPDDYLNLLNNVGTSDDVASIEADLESTDLSQLKEDIGELDNSLNP